MSPFPLIESTVCKEALLCKASDTQNCIPVMTNFFEEFGNGIQVLEIFTAMYEGKDVSTAKVIGLIASCPQAGLHSDVHVAHVYDATDALSKIRRMRM